MGKEFVSPAVELKQSLHSQYHEATGPLRDDLKLQLNEQKKVVSDKVAIAKANWRRKQAEQIHKMCTHPRDAWEASKRLIAGDTSHHNKPVTMRMRMEDGSLLKNPK